MKDNERSKLGSVSEWIEGINKEYQCKLTGEDDSEFVDCIREVSRFEGLIYREKPREFIKGHWYPWLDFDGDVSVKMFNGIGFVSYSNDKDDLFHYVDGFCSIGKSLGEIKFK